MKEGYQFELTLSKQDGNPLVSETGEPLGPIPVQVDFDPAREGAKFEALRREAVSYRQARAGDPEPVWDPSQGEPFVRAFSIKVSSNGHSMAFEFPTTYFLATARALSSYFVRDGQLKGGETFRYAVTSHPLKPLSGEAEGRRGGLCVRQKEPTLDVRTDRRLEDMMRCAQPYGDPVDGDMPVFVGRAVLDDVARQTEDAGSLEAGEFLLGHLHRCPTSNTVFLSITGQIPAEHTKQELVKLTFAAETFDAARSAVKERGRGELLAGWAHSHSWLQDTCKDCKKRKEGGCNAKADFFSEDDLHVHRTAFLKAFSVALVASHSPCSGLTWALYGWRLGAIRRRGFYVIPDNHNREGDER